MTSNSSGLSRTRRYPSENLKVSTSSSSRISIAGPSARPEARSRCPSRRTTVIPPCKRPRSSVAWKRRTQFIASSDAQISRQSRSSRLYRPCCSGGRRSCGLSVLQLVPPRRCDRSISLGIRSQYLWVALTSGCAPSRLVANSICGSLAASPARA
ncbi:hypothetical protein D3C72_1840460 [compost metagenome]